MVTTTNVISIYSGAKVAWFHIAAHHLSDHFCNSGKTQPRNATGDKAIKTTRTINLINSKRAIVKKEKASINMSIDAKIPSITILVNES